MENLVRLIPLRSKVIDHINEKVSKLSRGKALSDYMEGIKLLK